MPTAPNQESEWHEPPAPISLHRRRLSLAAPLQPLTPLVGRDRQVAAVCELLAGGRSRLVTLIGPGGIGKTRLALGVANTLLPAFDERVAWAPIATATTAEAVAAAIAQAIGVADSGSASYLEAVKAALHDVRLLLVLDNFEQVLEAAPLVTELLVGCPGISILVTSRALLRVAGETPVEVPPLSTTPDATCGETGPDAAPAVRLFTERAASVVPNFTLTAEAVPVVTGICRRLDGVPLAIELAAARANHLSLAELHDRLDRSLAVLTVSDRGAPARHRTMRDAIAWSYDLLTDEQRTMFRALAVFSGGFTFEAAEAVAGVGLDVLSSLGALVDNNLVRLEPGPGQGSRYTTLETIREYAAERLAASGEDVFRRRHAEYFLDLASGWYRTYWGDRPGDVRGRVRAEEANVRSALLWATEHNETDMTLQLALVMFDPLAHTGDNAREQQAWLQRGLALPGGSPSARVLALTRCASMVQPGELDRAMSLAEEALDLARRNDDAFGIAEALRVAGNISIHTGDRTRARTCLLDALDRFRALGRKGRVGWTLHHLSALEGVGDEPNLQLAATYCDEALAIFRELGHVRGVESTLNWHAECACKLGDLATALASAKEGLAMTVSDSWSYDYFDCFADIAGLMGEASTAAHLYGVADALREQARRPIEPAFLDERSTKMDVARRSLGAKAFAAAYEVGRSMSVDQAVAEALALEVSDRGIAPAGTSSPQVKLTRRELEVMRLLASGLSDRDIAETLFIGERTVNTHVAHIFEKLGVRNRAAAVTAAVAAGVVDASSVSSDFPQA